MPDDHCRVCGRHCPTDTTRCPKCCAGWPGTRWAHWLAALALLLLVPVLSTFIIDAVDDEPVGETLYSLVDAVQEEIAEVQDKLGGAEE